MLAEIALRKRQGALSAAHADDCNANGVGCTVDKWQLLRALSEGRARLCLSDRTLGVLEALLSFHREKIIDGSRPVIVFPSNRELSLRSRGMAPATLRRHLAALVAAGLILRRDSPNGKRYRRIDPAGEGMDDVFGFDLSPLALQSDRIFGAAEAERQAAQARSKLTLEISLHRRDARKVIEAALAEKRVGDWGDFALRLTEATAGLSRRADWEALKAIENATARLCAEVEAAYLAALTDNELSANDAENERHYQNSNTEIIFEPKLTERAEEAGSALSRDSRALDDVSVEAVAPRASPSIELQAVLDLCPDIHPYSQQPLANWAGLVRTADLVRSFLGISPTAWQDACASMGEQHAAVVIAAILQRADRIRSPGGYLRFLTNKSKQKRFNVTLMLRALQPARD